MCSWEDCHVYRRAFIAECLSARQLIYNHAGVRCHGVHLGTRSRPQTSSQRGQWCGAVSALQEWHNWVQTLAEIATYIRGKSTAILISVTHQTYNWPFLTTTDNYNVFPSSCRKNTVALHTWFGKGEENHRSSNWWEQDNYSQSSLRWCLHLVCHWCSTLTQSDILGMKSRLQVSSQRDHWCDVVSTLRYDFSNLRLAISYNWWLDMPTTFT